MVMKTCYCGVVFDTRLLRKRFCGWKCRDRYIRLINAKELMKLTPEDHELRNKALKFQKKQSKNYIQYEVR